MGHESAIIDQLRREQACIEAIHRKPCWRIGILLRRPWRDQHPTLSVIDWLFRAHDCSDPAVACSCSGSFRFPKIGAK